MRGWRAGIRAPVDEEGKSAAHRPDREVAKAGAETVEHALVVDAEREQDRVSTVSGALP
jgi:hypothetical protein